MSRYAHGTMRTLDARVTRSARLLAPLLLLALLLVPALVSAAAPKGPRPDYSTLRDVLRRYTVTISGKGEPLETRFDYEQFYVDEKIYGVGVSPTLKRIREDLLAVAPSAMTPAERTAWALNMHRFLVLERITLHLLVPNRKYLRYSSIDEMNYGEGRFLEAPVLTVDGHTYSIAEFERRVIYGDTATTMLEARARAGDPRIALALTRGTTGEPPPLPWVFTGDSLEAQLDRAARITLALPRFVKADEKSRTIQLSNYFFENRADYNGSLDGVRPLLAKLGSGAVKTVAKDAKCVISPVTMPVTRKLDQYERPKQMAPEATTEKS